VVVTIIGAAATLVAAIITEAVMVTALAAILQIPII